MCCVTWWSLVTEFPDIPMHNIIPGSRPCIVATVYRTIDTTDTGERLSSRQLSPWWWAQLRSGDHAVNTTTQQYWHRYCTFGRQQLHYTYNSFPIEYNIQRKLLKWLTWGQIVKSLYLNVWFAKLLHGFLKCESHSSGLLQSYHLSRSIIDIAKEICSGGFPKAYSIDVKIEEL